MNVFRVGEETCKPLLSQLACGFGQSHCLSINVFEEEAVLEGVKNEFPSLNLLCDMSILLSNIF